MLWTASIICSYILFCQNNTKEKRYLLFDFYIVLPFQNEGHCLHDLLPMSAHYVVYVLPKQGWNTFSVTPHTRKGHSCLNHSKWGVATLHTEHCFQLALPNQKFMTAETFLNILHVEPAFVWESIVWALVVLSLPPGEATLLSQLPGWGLNPPDPGSKCVGLQLETTTSLLITRGQYQRGVRKLMFPLWYWLLLQGHRAQVQQPHFQSLREGKEISQMHWLLSGKTALSSQGHSSKVNWRQTEHLH